MPGEYHFFPDEEVDAHSLADRSSYEIEDSSEGRSKQDSSISYAADRELIITSRPVLNASAIS